MARISAATFVGTTIEFYDFFIYGTATALIFGKVFFANLNALNGLLASFSVYAVAFFARPFGAVFFGHFGDRYGRKSVLVVSMLLMGLSTASIGVLPGYMSWGVWAPVALVFFRFLQGFTLGGEWGGAAMLASEHSPFTRRGHYAAYLQLGLCAGFILATGMFWILSGSLPESEFVAWGWRLAFLVSVLLVAVGLFIRLRVPETPAFRSVVARGGISRFPIRDLIRCNRRELLLATGMLLSTYVVYYASTTYTLAYATKNLGVSRNLILGILLAATCIMAGAVWLGATKSDMHGRRRVSLVGATATVVWAPLLFPLLDTRQSVPMLVALSGMLGSTGLLYGAVGAYMPELFPTSVRYTGASLSYNLGGVVGGATTPLVATQLTRSFGSMTVGWYMAAVGLVSLSCVWALPETRNRDLYASSVE
ncbi:MFS transporter [Streptomyces collinus]|uniref:MFS transporter n=1 Tax=Streptomyces collinus TaxID=42684 RepID=UPI003689013B